MQPVKLSEIFKSGNSYVVNFSEMTQISSKTSFKRDIYRLPRNPTLTLPRQRVSKRVKLAKVSELREINNNWKPAQECQGIRIYGRLSNVVKAEGLIRNVLTQGQRQDKITFPVKEAKIPSLSCHFGISRIIERPQCISHCD